MRNPTLSRVEDGVLDVPSPAGKQVIALSTSRPPAGKTGAATAAPAKISFFGVYLSNQHNVGVDQRRGEVPSFVVSRMGSRGREIEIPSPGVLSLFVHFLMGKRTRASAACERPFSGLLIPPRLLGVSPAALVGRNNPSKKVCSQVLHSFHRADLRRIEAQTADNTFVFSRDATKSRCKSACENRQRLISSCPCTSKEKMDAQTGR